MEAKSMGRSRSFKEYIADRFENKFEQAIADFVEDEDNISTLDLRLYKVRNIGTIEVVDTKWSAMIKVQYKIAEKWDKINT